MKRPIIYTMGDSHAWHCWLNIDGVADHTVGPMTLYRFGDSKPILVKKIPDGVIICFCYGEIDCRCHVHKHPPWEKTVEDLVKNYLDAIDKNVKDRNFADVWIFNVVPPPRRDHRVCHDKSFPFLGTDLERLRYVTRMNNLLGESKYRFVDVYDHYCDEDGFMIHNKSDGHVHIKETRPLKVWIENYFKEKEGE